MTARMGKIGFDGDGTLCHLKGYSGLFPAGHSTEDPLIVAEGRRAIPPRILSIVADGPPLFQCIA